MWFIQNHAIYIINVSFGGFLLLVTLVAVFTCGRRMLRAKWSGKRWYVQGHTVCVDACR